MFEVMISEFSSEEGKFFVGITRNRWEAKGFELENKDELRELFKELQEYLNDDDGSVPNEKEIVEFSIADLKAMLELLKKYYPEVGENVVYKELERISNDKFEIAACLAHEFHKLGLSKSISYINDKDIGVPIEGNKVIRITVDYIEPEVYNALNVELSSIDVQYTNEHD